MQPFSVVEAPSFINLVRNLAPSSTVMTRRMLVGRINARYEGMKSKLKATLEGIQYVTVTADCWTTFRR